MATENEKTAEKTKGDDVRMVKLKIPLTRSEADDVYVGVNGKSFLIKRGETVEVPEYVVEVLTNRDKMLAQALEFEASAAI